MKAWVYRGKGQLELVDRPTPEIDCKEALVKIKSTSICGTDLRTFRFGNPMIDNGRILGHEACGELVQIGSSIKEFHEGEYVVFAPAIGCGTCLSCRRGRVNMCDNLKTIGFDYDGTFAEYMKVPASAFTGGNVIRIDDTISIHEASLAEPAACCINGQSFLHITPDDVVLVFGAGFIGCMHAELALQSGAATVIVADISPSRLDIIGKLLPQIYTVNTKETDIDTYIREITGGWGADVVITANPDGQTQTDALRLAAKSGRISLFGGLTGDTLGYIDSNMIHYKELSIYGSHATAPFNVARVIDLVKNGRMELSKYISGTYPLENMDAAFESLKKGDVLKLLIQP